MVDSADRGRLQDCKRELHGLLAQEVTGCDIAGTMDIVGIVESLAGTTLDHPGGDYYFGRKTVYRHVDSPRFLT